MNKVSVLGQKSWEQETNSDEEKVPVDFIEVWNGLFSFSITFQFKQFSKKHKQDEEHKTHAIKMA